MSDPVIENLYLLYNKPNLLKLNKYQGPLLSTSIEDKSKQISSSNDYNEEDYLIDLLKEYILSKSSPTTQALIPSAPVLAQTPAAKAPA